MDERLHIFTLGLQLYSDITEHACYGTLPSQVSIATTFYGLVYLVSHASPSYETIKKGSGQKGYTNMSQRIAIIE